MDTEERNVDKRILRFCVENQEEQVAALINANPNNVFVSDCFNSTPLHMAAGNTSVECLQLLIKTGANVNAKNEMGCTPLHGAAECNSSDRARGWYSKSSRSRECLRILLEAGADVNAKSKCGWTPLHHASYYGTRECFQILFEAGADPNIENDLGDTPLSVLRPRFKNEMNAYINALSTLDIKEPSC